MLVVVIVAAIACRKCFDLKDRLGRRGSSAVVDALFTSGVVDHVEIGPHSKGGLAGSGMTGDIVDITGYKGLRNFACVLVCSCASSPNRPACEAKMLHLHGWD